jgi:hypothetical protein
VTLCGYRVRIVVSLLMAGLVVACGGKTLGGSAGSGKDSGTGATDGGAGCVNLEVIPSDLSCGSNADCELALTGEVCNDECSCGGTPVNRAAAARLQSETTSLTSTRAPAPPLASLPGREMAGDRGHLPFEEKRIQCLQTA